MYSKLVVGLAMAGAAYGAELVRRDTGGGGGGHGHGASHDSGHSSGGHGGGHGGGASHAAAAPSSGYSEPSSGYAAPSSGYSQPSSGYSQPSSGYSQPSSSYGGGGGSGYGGGYETGGYEEDNFDLSVIIIPLLVLFGLSLLFPTIVNINATNGGRKKREAGDEDASGLTDVVERVNDIYMAVVESEECMQRIACEIGGLAEDVGIRENSLTQMAETFVPTKYKNYYNQFQSGKNCHKINCGTIF